MYKSRLQELCQRRSWELPEYTTTKDGRDHMPRFAATVNVRGQVFRTSVDCRSSKDAQNTAARIAFEHFTSPQPPAPATQKFQTISLPGTPPPVAVDSNSPSPAVSVPVARIAFERSTAPQPLEPAPAPAPAPQQLPTNSHPATLPPDVVDSCTQSPVASVPVPPTVSSPQKTVPAPQQNAPESPLPSSLPLPQGLLNPKGNVNLKLKLQENCEKEEEDSKDTSSVHRMAICLDDKNYKETLHIYKNRLQQYAQKKNIGFPVYTCDVEGPPHARRFRSRVTVNGNSYETVEFFSTLKEAEQAAAKVACQVLSVDGIQGDSGLYKNLLQEFAQKKGLMCPTYETASSGVSHVPVFVSKVEIGSFTFKGDVARTKKQAEMNAAKVAYHALAESRPTVESARQPSSSVVENSAHSTQAMSPPKRHLHGRIGEEAQIEAKKAKTLPENVTVNTNMPGPENPTSSAFAKQLADDTPSGTRKTIVVPRSFNPQVPKDAEVKSFSDEKWLCYSISPAKETGQ